MNEQERPIIISTVGRECYALFTTVSAEWEQPPESAIGFKAHWAHA